MNSLINEWEMAKCLTNKDEKDILKVRNSNNQNAKEVLL